MAKSFVRWRLRADPDLCDLAMVDAWHAGATGFEDVVTETGVTRLDAAGRRLLLIYAPRECVLEIEALLKRRIAESSAQLGPAEALPAQDWIGAYRRAQKAIDITSRLRIRPPAVAPGSEGRTEVVLEARQAFGTGSHASTALALRWLDREIARRPVPRLLDAGCGNGVLGIAATKLGAGWAAACDCDRVAARETRENAGRNDVQIGVWCGSLDALHPAARFDVVVANMIRSELEPLLPALLRATARDGRLVVAGLLAGERARFEAELLARGARIDGELDERDERGDHWIALCIRFSAR